MNRAAPDNDQPISRSDPNRQDDVDVAASEPNSPQQPASHLSAVNSANTALDHPETSRTSGLEEASGEPTRRSFWWRYRRVGMAAAGGVMAALATPPTDIYPAMLLALVLLAAAIRSAPSIGRGFALGALWGSSAGLVAMRFVPSVIMLFTDLGDPLAWLAHVLLSMAQSLHWALGMALAVALHKRLRAPLEFAFPAGLFVALLMPGVFIWSPAGLLSPWAALLQSAEFIGERGVSALFGLAAALLVRAAHQIGRDDGSKRAAMPLALATALLGLMFAHGRWRMAAFADGEERARIAVVQAAVNPKERWQAKNWPRILQALRSQTIAAEREQVDLTVWPEAAYPYVLRHDTARMPPGRRAIVGGKVQGPVLFGLITRAPILRRADGSIEKNSFNSATIVDKSGATQPSYDKMELLLFGESVPLADEIPWLRKTFQRGGGLLPGNRIRPLHVVREGKSPLKLAVIICYEDTIPELGRKLIDRVEPQLLVNATNDAWFVGTEEPELHLRLAAMRSIELRRDTVRSVNLGVGGWIDAAGRVRARGASDEAGYIIAEPTLRNGITPYARYGDTPLIVFWLAGSLVFARRKRFLEAQAAG